MTFLGNLMYNFPLGPMGVNAGDSGNCIISSDDFRKIRTNE